MAKVFKVKGNQKIGVNFVLRKDGIFFSGLLVGSKNIVTWEDMASVDIDGQYAYISKTDGEELILFFKHKWADDLRLMFRPVLKRGA